MSAPRAAGALSIVFTVVYALAYTIAVWKNYALFTYHPVPGTLSLGVEKSYDGPAMYWYGWMATAAIAATVACLIAYAAPARLTDRIRSGWAWIVPIGMLIFFAYLLRGYFLR
jgi:hypothetical protein